MADVTKTREILHNLIETCRDGQTGFREAAEHLKNTEIREYFNQQSLLRAQFAAELEAEARRLGEPDVSTSGSTTGALHRTWMNLKASLGGDDHAIVAAAETGEDNAKQAYEEALQEKLPGDVLTIVRRQAESVFQAHNRVRAFRDQKAA